jgi:flagellar motor switch protein FliN/FliY
MTELNATPEKELPAEPQLPGAEVDDAALDDWASALAEQNDNSAVNATTAGVFQPLSKV